MAARSLVPPLTHLVASRSAAARWASLERLTASHRLRALAQPALATPSADSPAWAALPAKSPREESLPRSRVLAAPWMVARPQERQPALATPSADSPAWAALPAKSPRGESPARSRVLAAPWMVARPRQRQPALAPPSAD